MRVLGGAGLVDHVGELEGPVHHHPGGDVQERAAAPERRGGGVELVAVVGEAPHEVLGHELGVLAGCVLERAEDDAALGQLGIELDRDDAGTVLDEPAGERLLPDRLAHDVGDGAARLVVLGLERIEVQVAQARRPEARAPPGRHLGRLVDLQCRGADFVDRAPGAGARAVQRRGQRGGARRPGLRGAGLSHRSRGPPRGGSRSPRTRAGRPARRRPRARSAPRA